MCSPSVRVLSWNLNGQTVELCLSHSSPYQSIPNHDVAREAIITSLNSNYVYIQLFGRLNVFAARVLHTSYERFQSNVVANEHAFDKNIADTANMPNNEKSVNIAN